MSKLVDIKLKIFTPFLLLDKVLTTGQNRFLKFFIKSNTHTHTHTHTHKDIYIER